MRVAIIGAGPSGLACALELERLGISPAIFERSYRVGYGAHKVDAMLHLLYRPVRDQVRYLSRECNLTLTPQSAIRKITMNSYGNKSQIKGRCLGYLFTRGQAANSMENQLASRLKTPIFFDTFADFRELARAYDVVVVAQGDSSAARMLNCWQEFTNVLVKGAIVLGQHDPRHFSVYFDNRYARHAFGYVAPFSHNRASVHLCVPGIKPKDMDSHWNLFMQEKKELSTLPVVNTYEMEWQCGQVTRRRHGNLFLIGNSGGFAENFMGTGLFSGLISGILAARCIVYKWDYEALSRPLIDHIKRISLMRDALDRLDNSGLNVLVKILGLPLVRHLIYNTNLNIVRKSESLLKGFDIPGAKDPTTQPHRTGDSH